MQCRKHFVDTKYLQLSRSWNTLTREEQPNRQNITQPSKIYILVGALLGEIVAQEIY